MRLTREKSYGCRTRSPKCCRQRRSGIRRRPRHHSPAGGADSYRTLKEEEKIELEVRSESLRRKKKSWKAARVGHPPQEVLPG